MKNPSPKKQPRPSAIPPLPHPSWSHGHARRGAARSLSASDFWKRLGL